MPRAWLINGALVGLCIITGYGLGAFVGWAYRTPHLPDLPPSARRVAWRVVAVVARLLGAWFGRTWQSEQRALLGMDTEGAVALAHLALAGTRGRRTPARHRTRRQGLGRALVRPLGRVLPARVAWLLAIVATVLVTVDQFGANGVPAGHGHT